MKQRILPFISLMLLALGGNNSVMAISLSIEPATSIETHTVVKRFSTKGRLNNLAQPINDDQPAALTPVATLNAINPSATKPLTSITKPAVVKTRVKLEPVAVPNKINTATLTPLPLLPLLNTSPLTPMAPLNAATPDTVSPAGKWLNRGFEWINSSLGLKQVKPWQKAILAEPVMTGGVAPTLAKFATKVFISKEATLGGNGVAGGGCGCK